MSDIDAKLLAISMLEAIYNFDQQMIQSLLEQDPMVGTNALVAAVGMIGRLIHTEPLPAGTTTQLFIEQLRNNVLQEEVN
ncbi:hypothetical protein [Rhodococcoides fascians]|uniref:hypothetical protein n=1 Tax=Rhodococcoides fascians TaxID=1828 RepID=UPI0024B8BAB4|nr:hypothetical protein [Rhodococcus fascians]MDJ0470981.1 hypothetical protein [Rhodococcus fascians]